MNEGVMRLKEPFGDIRSDELVAVEPKKLAEATTRDIAKYFPQLFGKRRGGELFVRKLPVKERIHDANILKSFEAQDHIKNDYRNSEQLGHDARFSVHLPDGSHIVFSKFLSDWMLTNSTIANLYRCGWDVKVS